MLKPCLNEGMPGFFRLPMTACSAMEVEAMEPYTKLTKKELNNMLESLLAKKTQNKFSFFGLSRTKRSRSLLKELQIHRIELEMQNRELQESHLALEDSRSRYVDLYDSAPIGYLTLDDIGCIVEINLTGASMLGLERRQLKGHPFAPYVAPKEVSAFLNHISRCLSSRESVVTEVTLVSRNGVTFPVQLISKAFIDPGRQIAVCRTTLIGLTERRRSEEQIRFQALLLDQVGSAVIAIDLDRKIILWNKFSEILCQWKKEEALGQNVIELLAPEKSRGIAEKMLASLKETGLWEGELVLQRKDGSTFGGYLHNAVIRGKNSEIIGFVGVIQDITERKRAEEDLRSSQEQIRLLLDSTAEAIYGLDLQGRCTFANQACLRLLGYATIDDLLGKNMHLLIHHTRQDGTQYPLEECKIYQVFFAGQGAHVADERLWRADGSSFPAEYWFYPVYKNGVLIGGVVTFVDITERRQMEEALRGSEERFRLVSLATSDAIWDRDLLKNTFWWSENFNVLFRYESERINPGFEWWATRIHPEDRKRVLSNIDAAIQNGERFWFDEYRLLRGDGLYSIISDSGSIVRDECGGATRMIGAMVDITKRKQTEKELADYNRRLHRLSGRLLVAQETERRRIARELHDEIGQSLTAIILQLQGAQRHPDAAVSRLEECVHLAENALKEVRSLSLNLHPPQLDELGLIAALRWHLDRQTQTANLIAHFSADPLPARLHPSIEIACFRVAQEALTNVIRHAQATRVSVELHEKGAELHLIIADDGQGFDPRSARDRAVNGASLGLVGMQERTELAGGLLELNSSPGQGTKVHAVFPLTYIAPRTRSKKRNQ